MRPRLPQEYNVASRLWCVTTRMFWFQSEKKERKPPVGQDTREFPGVFASDRVSKAGPTRQSRIYRKTSTSSPEAKYLFRFSRPLGVQLVFIVTINPTAIRLGYVFHPKLP